MLKLISFVIVVLLLIDESSSKPPNIIFLLADDLGWNDVGFHGSRQVQTPVLDAMANDGVILNNYYTLPLCTPSRVSLMTGRHPVQIGMQYLVVKASQRLGIPLEYKLMPQYLNDLGYESHAVGKWHLGCFHKNYTPAYRGFKSFYGFYNGENDYFDHRVFLSKSWGLDWHLDVDLELSSVKNEFGLYSTHALTNRVEQLIEKHKFDEKPLFLYVSYQNTHAANEDDPVQAPTDTAYQLKNIWDVRRRKYVANANEMDTSVGKIMEALKKQRVLDNTIVVFSSDNGAAANGCDNNWGNNYPLRAGKGFFYEGGARAPAFVYGDMFKKRKGDVSTELMHISDWLPTLYEIGGGKSSELTAKMGSYNMLDVLTGKNLTSPRSEVLININPVANTKAIKVGKFKYLLNPNPSNDVCENWFQSPGTLPDNNETLVPDTTPSQVYCGDIPTDADFSCYSKTTGLNECMYNLENDPCEFYNLVDDTIYEKEKEKLLERLNYWESIQVDYMNPAIDPKGNPENMGFVWQPWTDDPRIPPNNEPEPISGRI